MIQFQLFLKDNLKDVIGDTITQNSFDYFEINTGKIKTGKLFTIDETYFDSINFTEEQIKNFVQKNLSDSFLYDVISVNEKINFTVNYQSYIHISKLPGVTDDEGRFASQAFIDFFNLSSQNFLQHISASEIYLIEKSLLRPDLKNIGENLLGNVLINYIEYGRYSSSMDYYYPSLDLISNETVNTINLNIFNDDLIDLSKKMLWSLDVDEMKVIKNYFLDPVVNQIRKDKNFPENPTDCELEIIAQTWSEHCKHKLFNAEIDFLNQKTGERKTINSLFKTYIYNATNIISKKLTEINQNWLIKVFNDNAGIVKIDKDRFFVFKVETHNAPSALDPYGGAITGILGNNRDPLGTGIGGAKLLFNSDVLCFGPTNYSKELLPGQLHPRRILSGVCKGIEEGGNQSGIPTINGAIIFDDRYAARPLVFCGTGAILNSQYAGKDSPEKKIDSGDCIIMVGGRVGKDGIHGATFSSTNISDNSPKSAVQIGSPITQKLLSDFLEVVCLKGLVKCTTDCGAGGLSSAIGELAQISNGAIVNLEKVPLKYSGLAPWEIFLSESQERMILVVDSRYYQELIDLSFLYEVEITYIGSFVNTGYLEVYYHNNPVTLLNLDFLHNGVPKKTISAIYKPIVNIEPSRENFNELDLHKTILSLLSSNNICSRESIIRQYDHEVKGKTIVKPLMSGNTRISPQDAAVIRLDFESYKGIAVSCGIMPKYGDIDPYEMSAGAFDEAVRQIVSIGGSIPNLSDENINFWSVNDNFCLPDSIYDENSNPDGKEKLGNVVRMCEALYDMSTFFNIPMTSGKDSTKNDFIANDNIKFSIPPTILYSMTSLIEDVRKCVTSEFKQAGDLIFLLGNTYNEFGGSEFYKLIGYIGANVPKVRKKQAKNLYLKIAEANKLGIIESSHDLSDGGLAIALVESSFANNLGVDIDLNNIGDFDIISLFSESHSRFLVTVKPNNKSFFKNIMKYNCTYLGIVTGKPILTIKTSNSEIISIPIEQSFLVWQKKLI